MDQSSKNSVALAGDDSAWPEASMDIAELPEDSAAIPSMGIFVSVAGSNWVPGFNRLRWAGRPRCIRQNGFDEKTVYTENGDDSGTASYDVSVLNEG